MPVNGDHIVSRDRIAFGIGVMVLAVFLLSSLDATVKWLTGSYTVVQIIFFRNLFALLPVWMLIHREGGVGALRTRQPWLHLYRIALILIISYSFFWAISHMELADATAIFFTVPLFITVLSIPLLGEQVGRRRWGAVAVGFLGALVILRPGGGVFDWPALAVLVTSIGYALLMISNRAQRGRETVSALTFYATIGALVVSGLLLPLVWTTPSLSDLLLLALVGLLGGVGQICLVTAFRYAPAVVIAPFDYTTLLWATFYGYMLWGDLPDLTTLIGAGVIALGGIYILRRETTTAVHPANGQKP